MSLDTAEAAHSQGGWPSQLTGRLLSLSGWRTTVVCAREGGAAGEHAPRTVGACP